MQPLKCNSGEDDGEREREEKRVWFTELLGGRKIWNHTPLV